jgi:hypothetical protein
MSIGRLLATVIYGAAVSSAVVATSGLLQSLLPGWSTVRVIARICSACGGVRLAALANIITFSNASLLIGQGLLIWSDRLPD